MNDDRWIIVPNWDKFQHYTDREPIWIKVYTELNSDDAWGDLSDSERGLLVTIWIEYARARGTLKVSKVPSKVGQKSRKGQLERLNDAGFIRIVASKPLALTRSREVEVEKKKKERVAHAPKPRPVDNFQPARANVLPKDPVQAIRTMITNGAITDLVELEAEIAGARLNGKIVEDLRGLIH